MTPYNSKRSNIKSFEIGDDYIIIEFRNGKKLKYTYASCGESHVKKMKQYARVSSGLYSYINLFKPTAEELSV